MIWIFPSVYIPQRYIFVCVCGWVCIYIQNMCARMIIKALFTVAEEQNRLVDTLEYIQTAKHSLCIQQ